MSVNDSFDLKLGFDEARGLRTAELVMKKGFPEKYLGKYFLREWTYGEKLYAEIEAEKIKAVKGVDEKDIQPFIALQVLATVRESPVKLGSYEDVCGLPGRVGTLLANICGYLNMAPDEEKKSSLNPS